MRSTRGPALVLPLALVACADASGGAGAGASGGGGASSSSGSASSASNGSGGDPGSGGAGGTPDLDKDPATVTDPEDCYYEGHGGDNAWGCTAAVIHLSEELPLDELTVVIEASDGTVFADVLLTDYPQYEYPETPTFYANDAATTLMLRTVPGGDESNLHYAPEWLDVEVRRNDVLVGAERFEPLEYACEMHRRPDDWCWESRPVWLEITSTELD